MRYALINSDSEQIAAYLYSGFTIERVVKGKTLIAGEDWAGFTLDALLDRLASGLHFGKEITKMEAVAFKLIKETKHVA